MATSRGRNEYMKEYRRRNPDRCRGYDLMKDHGISLEDYDIILKNQGGVCAICGVRPGIIGNEPGVKPKALAVDHSHTSVGVRGLLCTNCNLGIGSFFEDSARMRRAADYLDRHEDLVTKVRAGLYKK